jgi:uncharacterized protein
MAAQHFGRLLITIVACGYVGITGYMGHTLTTTEHRPFERFPEDYGLAYEEVTFRSSDDGLSLAGWLLDPTQGVVRFRPVIMVHGWKRDRQSELDSRALEVAAHLVGRGHSVLMLDLRGWGRSEGTRFSLGPAEARDVRGAIDLLAQRRLADGGVDLLGFSMGAATTLIVADADPRVRAVVEDSGYAELSEVLDREVPRVSGLPPLFTPGTVIAAGLLTGTDLYAVRPIAIMAGLAERRVPVLVIHGEGDTLVPVANGRRLAATYGQQAETYFVPGAEHVQAYAADPTRYLARVDAFFAGTETDAATQ